MHENVVSMANICHLLHRLHRADLVVGVHHACEDGVGTYSIPELLRCNASPFVGSQICDRKTQALSPSVQR